MQKVIPAILTADEKELKKQLALLKGQSNWVHIDIMDGKFVENTSVNLFALEEARQYFNLEIHLMAQHPEKYFEDCKEIGAKRIIFHFEATGNLEKVLEEGISYEFQKGIALNPETPLSMIEPVKEKVDSLLIMSVRPGLQGQEFILSALEKAKEARKLFPQLLIGIDGGIGQENIKEVFRVGVNYAVVGSAIMKAENPLEELRKLEEMV